MKVILRLFIAGVFFQLPTAAAWAQCNGSPNVESATAVNITSTTATLGGTVVDPGAPGNCNVTETGVEWGTSAGGPYANRIAGAGGVGPFTVNVVDLLPGTRIYYRGYGKNDNSNAGSATAYTLEGNFYTLALEPSAHAADLTATTLNNDEIELAFPPASDITNADGYIILIEEGVAVTLDNLTDGAAPTAANDFLHLLSTPGATGYTVTGLDPNKKYYFAIVPYNLEGAIDATYNYLTSAGFPTANATTEADVDVDPLSGGLASTGTPLGNASANHALMGFSLDASGPVTFQSVVIHLSTTTSGKLTNFRLCASNDGTFDGVGTDAPLTSGITITPTATEITITLSESILATPARNFFLVADVVAGVNSTTPSIGFSYDQTDFSFDPNNLSGTASQSRTYTFRDVTKPSLLSTIPADDATGVIFNLDKLVMTFDETVDNLTTAATTTAHQVIIYDAATDVAVHSINRNAVNASGTTTVEVNIPAGILQPNSDYYVKIGNAVIEDKPDNNTWDGIVTKTDWNFSTSGVIVNNVTSNICTGSFQSIGDIVIREEAAGDFLTSGEIYLDFAHSDFGYDISSVTVSAGPSGNTDITSVELNPKTLTRLTLKYNLDGTNDKVDVITISGLKVYASAAGNTTIINGNSITGVWVAKAPVTFATINVGTTTPPSPTLETSPTQDLLYCQNEDISATKVSVKNDGGIFTWYEKATLSTPLTTGYEANVDDLLISSTVVGTVKRYVVRVDGCQSLPLEVTFQVAPIPVADAGAATASICSGSPITLGGSPTLIGPSVAGPYQYLWSNQPPPGNFIDMGPNPVVSPTYGKDTTFTYTVKIIDANNCESNILDPNAKIAVQVDSTDEVIVYQSPLSTSFTLSSDPIELSAAPSINSFYSGNGVYPSNGKYYFDPDLAGLTGGSPHAITYTTELSNGCTRSEVRYFTVSNSSGSIVNLANAYCRNEGADPSDVLTLGPDWENFLAQDNAYYSSQYGYTYEFYDFQTYLGTNTHGTGVEYPTTTGTYPDEQHINPDKLQPYPSGSGTYAYIGMRVRKHVPALKGPLGIILIPERYEAPIFWMIQYVNIYEIPPIKVTGVREGEIVCDINENIELDANFETGTFEISRDNINWVSGPNVGISDNPVNSGKALFNPHNAYISTAFPAPYNTSSTGITDFYIRYTYVVPNTSGSDSSPCETTQIISFKISNNPSVAWLPFSANEFCYEAPDVNIQTNARNPGESDMITGFGVLDKGDGTAVLDPDEGLKAKAFATNSLPYTDYNLPENIIISATRADGNGCKTIINRTVAVHPLFPANFTEADLSLCYEDGPQNIVGTQPNGNFVLTHPNLTVNFPANNINGFDLRNYYDQAVANNADGTVMQTFILTFNTSDPVLGCKNSLSKSFSVNPPIPMDIGGLTPGMIVCGNGSPFELTGNQPSAGHFEISTSETSGFVSNALGLTSTTSGKATYSPSGAGATAGASQKSLYIRYSFTGPGCLGSAQTTEELIINPQPAISFSGSIPAANSAYCHEQGSSPTTFAITTNETSNVILSGFGITDNGAGNAVFNPTSAYQQSSLADNLNPLTDQTVRNILITARRTDALSCVNTSTINYVVNPLPTASFSPAQAEYCYEDSPVTLSGLQSNVSYKYIYRNTTPANYSPPAIYQPSTVFNPRTFFDDAVSKGANGLATLQFDLIYTAINGTTGCTNELSPITLTVSPRIPVAISGVEPGEIFCSNVTDKMLEFSPPGGTFRINGVLEPIFNDRFVFNPQLHGPASGTDYTFTYSLVTGNNCTNTLDKTVKVLPSPQAIFSVNPQCEGEVIAYSAETSTNLAASLYRWNFSGETKTGQNVEHTFPGVSSYYAKLIVEHPPYAVTSTSSLICSDSLQMDQVVGPYPKDIHFEFFNVCEEDDTNFEVFSNVPINRVSWDFGDGETTGFGILSENLSLPQTSGTYQQPVHTFMGANDELLVRLEGKTSDDFGGCPYHYERTISILKKWEPTAAEPYYDMSEIDDGKGFWVVEDRNGNASWDFSTAAKQVIRTNDMAWVTGATEPYSADDVSYVNSPCFDLSGFARPVVSIQHWTDTESVDGAVLQYSVDGGDNWFRLGDVSSGLDWYNRLTISSNPGEQSNLSSGWSLNSQTNWAVGKHTLDVLPIDRHQVRFRIAFASFNNRESRDGFAFNNVVIEERNRTILVENFTTLADSENNLEFYRFKAPEGVFNTAELVKIQYHHSPAGNTLPPDDLHKGNAVDQDARAAFYGLTNSPRAFIDGGFGQSSPLANFQSESVHPYFSLRSLVTSPVNISVDFVDGPSDQLNVKAIIEATGDIGTPGNYNVFIAIAEQSIMDQIYVLRKFLPNAAGTPLTSLSESDPAQEIIASYDMRHVTRLPNGEFAPFAVIVFVQHLETKDVLQTTMRQDGTASSEIVTGLEISFDNYIRVYPNPADDIMNIILPSPVKEHTPVKLFDSFGRQVYAGTLNQGEHLKTLDTKPLPAGVYLIQVSTDKGLVQKKVMIVHE